MNRERPPRPWQSGPNGQTESEGATQDKQQVRFTAILTAFSKRDGSPWMRSVSNWTFRW